MTGENAQDKDRSKGFHPILEADHPYIFIDSCIL